MERLAGETDSEYVARQTALRGEASARMRDKFGGSNRMQGLGSDSSYDPASGGYGGGGRGGGGINADDIGGQIGVMGQKSMRFLSESFATLQTGVKETAHTLEEQQIGQSLSSGFQSVTAKLKDPELTQKVSASAAWGWGAISTQAGSLWSKAADSVAGISEGDEPLKLYKAEDEAAGGARHKQMVGFGAGAGAAAAAAASQGGASSSFSSGGGGGNSGSGGWGGGGSSSAQEGSGIDDLLGSGWRDEPTPTPPLPPAAAVARPQSTSPPPSQPSYGSALPKAPASVGAPASRKTAAAAPAARAQEDDDFFGSFGVK
ncbi:unnamed protein product [Ectocarpus fasciculatus]